MCYTWLTYLALFPLFVHFHVMYTLCRRLHLRINIKTCQHGFRGTMCEYATYFSCALYIGHKQLSLAQPTTVAHLSSLNYGQASSPIRDIDKLTVF